MPEEQNNFIPAKASYKPSKKPAMPRPRKAAPKTASTLIPKTASPRVAAPKPEDEAVPRLAEENAAEAKAAEPKAPKPKVEKPKAAKPKIPKPKITKPKAAAEQAEEPKAAEPGAEGAGNAAAPKKALNELDTRLASGGIYVAVTSGCLLLCNLSAALVLALTAGICAWELFNMMRAESKFMSEYLGIVVAAAYPLSVYFWGMPGTLAVTAAYLLILLILYVFETDSTINNMALNLFGSLYTGLLLSSVLVIRQGIGGFWGGLACVIILASIWFNDGAAYIVGSKIGKHKMAPKTSPKKSWEGFIAGVIVSMLMWCLMMLIPTLEITWTKTLICGFVCGIVGVLGDLAESRIKRNAGVKDSGNLLPGHGGLLDRSDSLLLVAAFAAILLYLFGCMPIAGL